MGSALIEEGQAIGRRCLHRNQPGPYQLQAAINAVHADAPTVEETDWAQIVGLYDRLLAVAPTPVVPRGVSSWADPIRRRARAGTTHTDGRSTHESVPVVHIRD